MNLNYSELYLLICNRPYGEQIAIHENGEITVHDSSLILTDPRICAVLKAEGDFSRSDWGVTRNDEGFIVDGLESQVFESSEDALVAAVDAFGLRAEDIDELTRQINSTRL